ncbi:MAG TPA: adenylate/guanylate cyclase domain-containing protein [Anaerolineae bacterium]|nr:adenylate/guanylate cyclase domain-containing protein [Anaerolineae bacterium]
MTWSTRSYKWEWQLRSTPEQLWVYASDTHRFNQAVGLDPVRFEEIPLETGGTRLIAHTTQRGIIPLVYEDHPFDWVRHEWYRNRRTYHKGPLADATIYMHLYPKENGSLLQYHVDLRPLNFIGALGIPFEIGMAARKFDKTFHQMDDFVQKEANLPYPINIPRLSRLQNHNIEQFSRTLINQGYPEQWVETLEHTIRYSINLDLVRLRPFDWADKYRWPRRLVLEFFLDATKLGLLDMRWDMMCPLCRGAKQTSSSLDEVKRGVHCPTCNINFDVNFSENVELTFIPNPQVREVYDDTYCLGNPMWSPHIWIQQVLAPDEERQIVTQLPAGKYRLRTQQLETQQLVKLPYGDRGLLELEANDERLAIETEETAVVTSNANGLTIKMKNKANYIQRFFVEDAAWYDGAVTADYVTSLQKFRDLFDQQVLRPGEEIAVLGLTILFSDLVGSTAMYNAHGDAASYGIVREQFAYLQKIVRDNEGAIVKTIGDAIMATFTIPANGVQAAIDMQKQLDEFNTIQSQLPIKLKLGLHHGPCIAVNLSGRLDYFGTTVNLAARMEGQSQGDDIIISEHLYKDVAIQKILNDNPTIQVTSFTTPIKGFDAAFQLYRLQIKST